MVLKHIANIFAGAAPFFLITNAATLPLHADTWRGTAPFCKGRCLAGESTIGESKYGDGGRCATGKKVLCRNSRPTCVPRQTLTSCYGAVQVCDNGYYAFPDVWRSCSKYACGVCVGFDF